MLVSPHSPMRYSPDQRDHWLEISNDILAEKRPKRISLKQLVQLAGTPSRSSIFRWRHAQPHAQHPQKCMGRPAFLNEPEKQVISGRVLWRMHHPKPVSADWVINWIRQVF